MDWVGITFVGDVLSSEVGIFGINVFTGPVILLLSLMFCLDICVLL